MFIMIVRTEMKLLISSILTVHFVLCADFHLFSSLYVEEEIGGLFSRKMAKIYSICL